MTLSEINNLINNPVNLNKETLYSIRIYLAQYPYHQLARVLYLKNLYVLHDNTFGEELRKSVLYIYNRRLLFLFIESIRTKSDQPLLYADDEREVPTTNRTIELIDSFLQHNINEDKNQTSEPPAIDYISLIEKEYKEEDIIPKMEGQELIDSFINREKQNKPILGSNIDIDKEETIATYEADDSDIEDLDESLFTESLAKIYVKQQKYSKAIQIIKKISLKYPKKSIYFAEKIKEIEEKIINTQNKSR